MPPALSLRNTLPPECVQRPRLSLPPKHYATQEKANENNRCLTAAQQSCSKQCRVLGALESRSLQSRIQADHVVLQRQSDDRRHVPKHPAATEDERNCSRWLGILGESNLSQDNTDVMLACLEERRGREGEKRQPIKSSRNPNPSKKQAKEREMTRRRRNPGSMLTTLSVENSYGNNTHIGSKSKQTRDDTQMLAIQQGIFLFSQLVFSLQTIEAQKQLPERNTAEKAPSSSSSSSPRFFYDTQETIKTQRSEEHRTLR